MSIKIEQDFLLDLVERRKQHEEMHKQFAMRQEQKYQLWNIDVSDLYTKEMYLMDELDKASPELVEAMEVFMSTSNNFIMKKSGITKKFCEEQGISFTDITIVDFEMFSDPTVAVNDHTCPHCKNDRVGKTEKSCWKCGEKL